jgi:glyoxylase-like metal-dependent hydrolase (beta-lactamase superfamily II)
MKTFALLLTCILALSSGPLHAQQTPAKLTITHLTGDFYVYTTYSDYKGTPYPSNSMYVVTGKGVILIDTPWDSTQFQPLLDSIAIKHHQQAVLCIATHFHEDRTGGLAFFQQKGIATWSSAYTKQLCIANNQKQAAHTFTKDTVFTVGNYRFEAFYPGEGHSKDNIVIWFNKEKVLYGGCLIKSTEATSLGNLNDANVAQWGASINKVKEHCKRPLYVIPGHLSWTDTGSLRHTLELLQKGQ